MQNGSIRRRSPHIGNYSGKHVDYNGVGAWSIEGIRKRYEAHAHEMGTDTIQLVPMRHEEGERTWVYPLMEQIIKRIEEGDKAAIEIGIEFIEEEAMFPMNSTSIRGCCERLVLAHSGRRWIMAWIAKTNM